MYIADDVSEYKVEHPSDAQEEAPGVITEEREQGGEQDTQDEDGFIMRISRSSSFACPQPPRPINRSEAVDLSINIYRG